jgi:hypothetical protein
MTFPGTYNLNYYLGDTLEFRVYPKNANGSAFDLDTFTSAKFTLAPTRGASVDDQISCYATISADKSNVLCAITPENSLILDPAVQYVYDVEIRKSASPYDIVYSLLTGNVSITSDITLPETAAAQPIPDNPTDLVVNTVSSSTIEVSWTAPTSGGQVTNYKLAVIPYTTDSSEIATAIENSTTTISASSTAYVFFGLSENTDYSVIISSSNATGDADSASALTNLDAVTTDDDPTTLDPDFFVTNDGMNAYIVNGVSNGSITVTRGQTYIINVDATGHPFWIQTVGGGYSAGDVYNTGVTNNGTESGNILWTVPVDAPDTLFYQCEFHTVMGGVIAVVNDGVS